MPRRTSPLLSEALEEFQTIRSATHAKTTLQNDHSVLSRFVKGVGNPQCHKLTPRSCELYFAKEGQRQIASSFNKTRTRVQLFVRFMQRRGYIDADPTQEIGTKRVLRRQRLQLTEAELREVITGATRPRDRAFLAVAANTALRASDLTNLRVGDVDLDAGYISLVIQKTQEQERLPITAELDSELRTWLVWYSNQLASQQEMFPDRDYSLKPDSYLLPPFWQDHATATRVSPDVRMQHSERIVQAALARLGYDTKGEGAHTIRRSVARLMFDTVNAEGGHDGSMRITAALLGHKNIATTELYLGISADKIKRDELLRGRSFLPTTSPDTSNVRQLREVRRA